MQRLFKVFSLLPFAYIIFVIIILINDSFYFVIENNGQHIISKNEWLVPFFLTLLFTYYILPVLQIITLIINIVKSRDKRTLLIYSLVSLSLYTLIILFNEYEPWFCFWGCIID
jgi:hypothetical protein